MNDGISITTLKLCNSCKVRPRSLIFQDCPSSGPFPDDCKKDNIVPVHKKKAINKH